MACDIGTTRVYEAALDQLPRILDLGRAFRDEFAPAMPWTPSKVKQTCSLLIKDPGHFLLLADRGPGTPVEGMIGVFLISHLLSGESIASEAFWYVTPEARGAGSRAGSALLCAAERAAQRRGAQRMQMIALASNPSIGASYLKRGYTALESTFEKRF